PEHHDNVGRLGRQLEDVLDQIGELEVFSDERGIFLETVGRQRPPVHPGVNDGCLRKQTILVFCQRLALPPNCASSDAVKSDPGVGLRGYGGGNRSRIRRTASWMRARRVRGSPDPASWAWAEPRQ